MSRLANAMKGKCIFTLPQKFDMKRLKSLWPSHSIWRHTSIWVNIVSKDDLFADGTKKFSKSMLTYHQMCSNGSHSIRSAHHINLEHIFGIYILKILPYLLGPSVLLNFIFPLHFLTSICCEWQRILDSCCGSHTLTRYSAHQFMGIKPLLIFDA